MDFFVHPWFMAAGGGLVLSPIIIHLINRMRFKRVRWAAMEFLLKSQKRNRRRLIIEQLILLLLRILLVLLAAFLLARYLYAGMQDQGGTKHFVILDDTLSMRDRWKEEGKYVTCFDKGKEELLRVAQNAHKANSAQEMVVYLLSNLEEPLFDDRLKNDTLDKLADVLNRQKPTALHLSPADGIEKGGAYLRGQPQGQKILHYVGDFRENKWASGAEGERTMKAIDKAVDSGINVSLLDMAHPKRSETRQIADYHDNLAITDMRAETRIIAEGVPVEFTVTLWNYSKSEKKTHLRIFIDGKEDFIGSRDTANIPANDKREEKFTLSFQKKKPSLDIRPTDPPDLREQKRRAEQEFIHICAEISTEETGLQADNYRDLVIEIRKKVPALLIDGSDGKEGIAEGGDVHHVWVALMSANSKAYEVERHTVDELDKLNLDLYPSIYLLNVREIKSETAIAKLADYVRRGGGLCYFIGPKAYVPFYNEQLHVKQKGLFPVPLAASPNVVTLNEQEIKERLFNGQPKILFPYRPPADKGAQVASSNPDSIVASLAAQPPALYRYLLIQGNHPPRMPRSDWVTEADEKVQEIVKLPNTNSMDSKKSEAQNYVEKAIELTRDLSEKDPAFKKYEQAMIGYRNLVRGALGTEYLYNLANAFDHLLKDVGVEKDDSRPNMKNLWEEPTMVPLKAKIEDFINDLSYGDPLVVARPYGKGRIVACLTSAGTSSKWNEWGGGGQASWTYPMFIMDLQRYLTSTGADLNRTVGDKVEFQLEAAKYKSEYVPGKALIPLGSADALVDQTKDQAEQKKERIIAYDNIAQPLTESTNKDGVKLLDFKLTDTRQPGVYAFKFTQQPIEMPEERAYAFNIDASAEGDLRRAAREKLERSQLSGGDSHKGKIVLFEIGDDLSRFKQPIPDASESPWLYLLILVILIVEQALAVHLSFHLHGDAAGMPASVPVPVAA